MASQGDGTGADAAAARSAERRAEVAETEGFHPLRLRPYVPMPDEYPAGTTARPLIGIPGYGPDLTDLGRVPAGGHAGGRFPTNCGLEYATDIQPVESASGPAPRRDGGGGSHRRRRGRGRTRGFTIAATAMAATALTAGAVAVANQLLAGPERSPMALPDDSTVGLPDVALPSGDAVSVAPGPSSPQDATPTTAAPAGATDTPPDRTAPTSATSTPSANRTTVAVTGSLAPAPSATVTIGTGTSPGTGTRQPAPPTTPPPSPAPTRTAGNLLTAPAALKMGDKGPQVADLQQRLQYLGLYEGDVNGKYDWTVRDAVATYQQFYDVTGDPSGVYGPNTRASLVAETS